jgi:hypothetical protein
MKQADKDARSTDDLPYSPALVEKVASSAERHCRSGLDAAVLVSSALCATDELTKPNKSHVSDAEVDGRVVLKKWGAIEEQGVFVGPKPIAAGEILGVLEGVIVRRRRLTRSERRRLIGIRVDGRAAHIDVEDRWPGKINHAPPGRYGVGFWVDHLTSRDYAKLPKDQREFFDVMHAVVDNYAWLSRTFQQRTLSQAMRIGMIALYVSRQYLGSHIDRSSTINEASSQAKVAVHDTNPLVQYMLGCGMDLSARCTHQQESLNEDKNPPMT